MMIDENNYKDFMSDTSMNCIHRRISEIKYLPDGLVSLYCHNNQLTSLPELPDGLVKLDCEDNQLPIEGAFYNKEEINEFKIKLDNIIKLEKFLLS